jgi:hypothetical protein
VNLSGSGDDRGLRTDWVQFQATIWTIALVRLLREDATRAGIPP